ncbi:MAG: glutamate racemase [Clostridia bacterium]|nr:glutamate racemase [Clostridia bacterium]
MKKNSNPIGVFDSGVGGLTVVKEIMRQIPNENLVYFGDTARVPYGNKSTTTIIKYTRQIIRFLDTHDVKAIVVACNTMSACSLEEVEKELKVPIIGVVKPGAKAAVERTKNHKIGVIATQSTINSRMYERFIQCIDPKISVYGKACPLFVPLVEEGLWDDSVTYEIASRYLDELQKKDIDALILGCTHYPLLKHTIAKVVGENINLVNPAYETSRELKHLLEEMDLINEEPLQDHSEQYRFYVSDVEEKFRSFAETIFADVNPYVAKNLITKQVDIERY